jgi:predicted ribosome quality control (RQC) complex YloA/Tae2 family protein
MRTDNTFPDNTIKIGENKEENDKIIQEAKQTDIWFHLHNLPSCHIIITNNSDHPITKQMIHHCANLVKQNTKYKNLPKVKVNYCPIKNVKRTEEKGKVILKGKIESLVV